MLIFFCSFRSNSDSPTTTTSSKTTNSQSTYCYEFLQDRSRSNHHRRRFYTDVSRIQLSIEPSMITVSQHCEISIALGIYTGLISPSGPGPFTEIGISKRHSCWLCELFLSCLESKSGHKFAVTTGYQQWKVHVPVGGWYYPVDAGEVIINPLLEILHKELGELRGMADPRQRSHSFPVFSPKATGEQFESEEKLTQEMIDEIIASRAAKKKKKKRKNSPWVRYAKFDHSTLLAPHLHQKALFLQSSVSP